MDKFYAIAIVAMIFFAIAFVIKMAFFNKQHHVSSARDELGLMAINLLREMQSAEKIDAKQQRIPRVLALLEERDRLIQRVDKLERDEIVSRFTEESA